MNNEGMISVEEARSNILKLIPLLSPEIKALAEAHRQVLAEDVFSSLTIPPLDNTAMDGYAVLAEDTVGASADQPVKLRIIGEVAAGYIFSGEVTTGNAVRIMTGAPIPPGADAVVPFEETDEKAGRVFGSFAKGGDYVGILQTASPGANLRYAGEDIRSGSLVMQAGTELGPAQLGVLASLGLETVTVHRRPIVAIISTGDELLLPGQPHEPGRIYDSNAPSLAALITEAGASPLPVGIARDTIEDLTEKLQSGLKADLIVTSAGVSRGDYDVVKDVLVHEGEVEFWTVRMRPGKPLAFGTFPSGDRRVPHLGLPGNPVSSMVAFELFGRPAIYKMMGRSGWERPRLKVRVRDRVVNPDGRRFYARAIVSEHDGQHWASLTGPQGSGILSSMALANALVVCPEDVPHLDAGTEAEAMMLGPVQDA